MKPPRLPQPIAAPLDPDMERFVSALARLAAKRQRASEPPPRIPGE